MLIEIVDLMTETVCTRKASLVIASDTYSTAIVKSKLLKLTSEHIEYAIDCMRENTLDIRNIKKYLLAAVLYLTPITSDRMGVYIQAKGNSQKQEQGELGSTDYMAGKSAFGKSWLNSDWMGWLMGFSLK